jgi:hypothetical protein
MGGNSSKQTIETTLETDVLNKNIQNFLTTNSQKVAATGLNRQFLKLKTGNVTGCNIDLTQTIDSEVVSTGTLSEQKLQDLQAQAQTHLDTKVDALMEKMSGFGTLQIGNDTEQDTKQTIKNKLQNITERTFDTKNYNELLAKSINIQEGDYEIGNYDCTKSGSLNISQDITSKLVATALTDQIVDTFMKDEQVADVVTQIEAEQSNRDEGVGEAVGEAAKGVGQGVGDAFRGIGEGVGNIFGGGSLIGWIILIIAILFIFGIGYYFYKKSAAKKDW